MSEFDAYDREDDEATGFDPVAHMLQLVQDPLGILKRRWLWMLPALLVGLAGTGFFVSTLQPMYVASATVLVSSQQIPEDFVRTTVRERPYDHINEMLGKILSQKHLSTVIDEYTLYPKELSEQPRASVIGQMRSRIYIAPAKVVQTTDDRSQIYKVSFMYADPKAAADVTNALASLYVESTLERRTNQARYTTEFLRREMQRIQSELSQVNSEISEFRTAHRGELPGDMGPALARLERLGQQHQSLSLQISEREDRILVLSGATDETGLAPESDLDALRRELKHQLGIYTEDHPNIISLRSRIELLEESGGSDAFGSTGPSEKDSLIALERVELKRLRQQLALVDSQIHELDRRVDEIPAREEELSALEQRAEVLRTNYLDFLGKVQDAELAETLESSHQQGPRASILDRAQPPTLPTQEPLLFLALGIAASLGLACGVGVLLELIDPVVLSGQQLESLSGRSLLGSMPQL